MLAGLTLLVFSYFRKGHDDFFLDSVCLIRPLLNVGPVFHDVGEQERQDKSKKANRNVVEKQHEHDICRATDFLCNTYIKRFFPNGKMLHHSVHRFE